MKIKALIFTIIFISVWSFVVSFDVIWNVPTQQCRHKLKLDFPILLRSYGILVNDGDTFQGDEMTIYYESQLGLYPSLSSNGTEINGGIPQLGDIEGHLKKAEQDLKKIPKKQTSVGTVRVIDWEAWRPTWEFNWGSLRVYQEKSKALVKKTNPALSSKEIDKRAQEHWENATIDWMLQTLQLAKRLQPNSVWGYYLFPDCYNYEGNSAEEFQCPARVKKENDKLKWLWDSSTALFPSIYLYTRQLDEYSAEQRAWFTNGRLQETLRFTNPKTKIYPYINFDIKPGALHPEKEFWRVMAQVAALGMDGVVVWGSSASISSEKLCLQLRDYIVDVLGPASKSIKWNTAKCSKEMCHGRGACAWNDDSSVVAWKNFVKKEATKFYAGDIWCRCQHTFKGRFCESENLSKSNE